MSEQSAPMVPMTEFMIKLMGQNARDAAYGFQASAEHWQKRAERAEATLAVIRETIHELYEEPYAPSQRAVIDALYPKVGDPR